MPGQWKEHPPGVEQKLLEQLFREGLIDDCDAAPKIHQKYPEFKEFSEKVFCTHFRTTKAKLGVFAKGHVNRNYEDDYDAGSIAELGPIGPVPYTSSTISRPTKASVGLDGGIHFHNAPYFTWVYTDHIKNYDFVCVAIPVISGSRDVDFKLSDDGQTLHIKYVWPTAMYTPQELFKDFLKGNDAIKIDHPKIHAFASRLLECELTQKSKPQGTITITLPVKVQMEVDTYTKAAVKSNNANIVLLEFQAYQKKQFINDADTSINFN